METEGTGEFGGWKGEGRVDHGSEFWKLQGIERERMVNSTPRYVPPRAILSAPQELRGSDTTRGKPNVVLQNSDLSGRRIRGQFLMWRDISNAGERGA